MFKRSLVLLATIAGGLPITVSAVNASPGEGDRVLIVRMDDRRIEGVLKEETPTAYKLEVGRGMTITIPKSGVREIINLDRKTKTSAERGAPGAIVDRTPSGIDQAEIDRILGASENFELLDVSGPAANALDPLPANEESVEEMMRFAGAGSKNKAQRLDTDHFVFVYTSEGELARKLGSRLEGVYRWVHKFEQMLGLPTKRPEYKLEIYFFGTFDEYKGYQSNMGFVMENALGFYMRTNNRSAFFDMMTWPRVAAWTKQLKEPNIPFRTRRLYSNYIRRWTNHLNLEVVQHEAAHHVHFNLGVFNGRGDMPRWVTEGLAQMFEVKRSSVGGILGATNHYRLSQLRQRYGKKMTSVGDLRLFIVGRNFNNNYPLAWSIHHYLFKKHREGYSKLMRTLAQREDDVDVSETQFQQEFEDALGLPIDEDFVQGYLDYLNSISLRWAGLP